jgi:hypothetical protein
MAVMPSPEEMQMQETLRRLRRCGFTDDMDKLINLGSDKDGKPVRLLRIEKKVPDERKDTKVKETPFPGEFTVMRIPG